MLNGAGSMTAAPLNANTRSNMETPDTPSQAKAREEYEAACRELAAASVELKQARLRYDAAQARYMAAHGAARHAGIVK